MSQRNGIRVLDWLILLGALALTVMASEKIGLPDQWQDGAVYTVVMFAAIILSLRPAWNRAALWKGLALVFTGHLVVVLIAVQALPHGRFGFPKLLLIPIGAVEGLLILSFLWRRLAIPKASKLGDGPKGN